MSLPRQILAAALLALPALLPAQSSTVPPVRLNQGRYAYNTAPVQEGAGDPAGIPFSRGLLTDGDPGNGVYWAGKEGAPLRMQVVFDLQHDVPLSSIVLHTRRPNRFHRTDSVAVDVRGEADTRYRVALFAREGVKDPWERIDVPAGGRPVRYVRVTFTRRHSFVNTPISEVEFLASTAPGALPASPAAGNLSDEFSIDTVLTDRYGQFLYEDWPGKIASEADFRRDLAAESARLADVKPDPERFDRYGGRRGVFNLKATGFFRLEKAGGRWWFVTPEGNPYFMNGVCVTAPHEGGYGTALHNAAGELRGVFGALPDRKVHAHAYTTVGDRQRVSFLAANLREKYGPDHHRAWTEFMNRRLLDWGFNANAKWTQAESLRLPYISVLRPAAEARRIKWAIDPYDPDFARNVEAGVRESIAPMRDDPLLIGHTFESEKGWDLEVFAEMLKLRADSPAKAAFIDFLRKRHRDHPGALRKVLGTDDVSRESLLATGLALPETLHADAKAFIHEASKHYYRTATAIIRRLDPNHLILGSSLTLTWHSSYEWEIGAVGFTDALSFDYYVSNPAWIEPYLKFDRPILLLEYSFVVNGRGMPGFHTTVATQRDRGLSYRHFIENLAATPQFVGAGWFLLYDQPVTGRDLDGGGERHNFGLLNQQDQPYEEMLDEVRKTSHRLFDVHAGRTAPFKAGPAD